MGGSIKVESEPDQGSNFKISINTMCKVKNSISL